MAAFISAEDQNFSMFNYVNELNQEAEKLEEAIKDQTEEQMMNRDLFAWLSSPSDGNS